VRVDAAARLGTNRSPDSARVAAVDLRFDLGVVEDA
jgi:hypothetical protein